MKVKLTGDQALIKKMNTRIVLDCILNEEPISRAKIAKKTGLNKATVSSLVQDLIDNHLVIEGGTGESSGGRKPVILHFNHHAGYAIGIDLGVNYIHGILTDLHGNVLIERQESLKVRDHHTVLASLRLLIDTIGKQVPKSPYGLVGIGIGVPGIVDEKGTVLFAPNLNWHQLDLRSELETRYKVQVTIENEANAGALGEQKYGAGQNVANLIYISAGIGIGTGLILNNELYKGSSGFSGELGHMTVDLNGKVCSCGNRGCWELYASEQALLEGALPFGFENLEQLLAAADKGDKKMISLLEDTAKLLGAGAANIANIFNPDLIIVGNRITKAAKWMDTIVSQMTKQRALPHNREHLAVRFAALGESSAVRGAAYAAIESFLLQNETAE